MRYRNLKFGSRHRGNSLRLWNSLRLRLVQYVIANIHWWLVWWHWFTAVLSTGQFLLA